MTVALRHLGLKVSHWHDHDSVFNEAMSGQFRWSIMQEYDSVLDLPVPSFFRELHVEWGNEAKFIFTYRKLDTWLKSQEKHMALMVDVDIEEVKLLYGAYQFDRDLWAEAYMKLYKDVVSFNWSPNQLLMFSAEKGDGYDKLCKWLSKPVPQAPYPHIGQVIKST